MRTTRKGKSPSVELQILGCGTSTGVPLLFCKCSVCRSKNSRNQRLRASAWVKIQGKSFLIDTSTDLRQQALRAKIPRVDAVLYTHPHADHIHGIDELRSFNYIQKSSIPLYGNAWTSQELNEKFSYIFRNKLNEGGGIPLLTLHTFDPQVSALSVCGVEVIPIAVRHGSRECVGYRFGSIAYVTDCSLIPEASMERLRNLSVLVLDCLKPEAHPTHFNLEQALAVIEELKPKKAYLTHLGHAFDYTKWQKKLPRGVMLAFDGLKVKAL